jgi:hypothetical protein
MVHRKLNMQNRSNLAEIFLEGVVISKILIVGKSTINLARKNH